MAEGDLSADRIREVLDYDPESGDFKWRVSRGAARAGAIAGTVERNGYRRIKIDGRFYYAHRVAHVYVVGTWPERHIDHRNGARTDNRWGNLRQCDAVQNAQNACATSTNSSGLRGVYWYEARSKWRAQIMSLGKNICLGLFATKEEAHAAYLTAKASLHAFQPVPRNA